MSTRQLAHLSVPIVILGVWTGCGQALDDEEPSGSIQQKAEAEKTERAEKAEAESGPPSAAQTPLDPNTIPKFAHELPIPGELAPTFVTSGGRIIRQEFTVSVAQTSVQMLPPGFPDTTVMAYGGNLKIPGSAATEFGRTVPGPVMENTRGLPTRVFWRNQITTNHFLPIDPTLHWANPNFINPPEPPFNPFPPGYSKALSNVPLVTHNHGLVVLSGFDGVAEEWFTNSPLVTGPSFVSRDYDKPNEQPGTQLFYHDHTMGMTRIGLYSGLLGTGYFIRDPNSPLDKSTSPLPKDAFEIPLVFQDRAFFTDGELNFPRESDNPSNAYWSAGEDSDTVLVNGKVWPNLNVQRRQYRFRMLAGANARTFTLSFDNNGARVPFTIIGSDGGYLPKPQTVDEVTIGITERADVLVDFSKFAPGTRIIMRNSNLREGEDPNNLGVVMRFTVANSPAVTPPPLSASLFPPRATLTADAPRRIKTFHNIFSQDGSQIRLADGIDFTQPTTDFPVVGSTEEWSLVNIVGGADHQVHLHLIEFQVVSRQDFDSDAYLRRWLLLNGHRPVTRPIPVDPAPFLVGPARPPLPYETGWKDTVRVQPGTVVKILARWAPQETPSGGVRPGENQFPLDPTSGPGYLWHCHVVAHEDHDMMRKLPLINLWRSGASYSRGTVISYQNVNYRALADHVSQSTQPPRGSASWERVNNNDGTWQPQITYAAGDRVLDKGQLYVASQTHQAQLDQTPSLESSLWEPLPMTTCGQLARLCQGETDPGASACHDLGKAGDENACGGQFEDCLAACHDNGGSPHEAASPCSGLCTTPRRFDVPDNASFNSGTLGTRETCHETTSQIATGTCNGLGQGRRLTVNGVAVSCNGNNWRLPTQRNHGYCIQTTAHNNGAGSFNARH
ncbi:carbohydrate-binding protein [Pendulispora albinea]|uniref:Multicopper oxidase domain-containing protein n=1 Tax=Pendulispora albinea TaxID=2741071 RepID=A0ABZ2MBK6_9BACT